MDKMKKIEPELKSNVSIKFEAEYFLERPKLHELGPTLLKPMPHRAII